LIGLERKPGAAGHVEHAPAHRLGERFPGGARENDARDDEADVRIFRLGCPWPGASSRVDVGTDGRGATASVESSQSRVRGILDSRGVAQQIAYGR
jgi:hypothetical protein